ncbi:MAG: hypothetical protein GC136_06340 [Alphaproteobacteria bacterium]|nr:hypothetical protein [Alphaproteobacteria bacterium]
MAQPGKAKVIARALVSAAFGLAGGIMLLDNDKTNDGAGFLSLAAAAAAGAASVNASQKLKPPQ